jgi:UDP-N-acetylglucosamine 2-epimerase
MKFFLASFNRASDGALSKLIRRMKEEHLWTYNYHTADYIIAPGDRIETLHFIIDRYNENKPIIHLWAGEQSQGTHDETWRRFITEMSMMQLCTNNEAKQNLPCQDNAYVIGNLMLDNLVVDESLVPGCVYDVVLYNPPTVLTPEKIQREIRWIQKRVQPGFFWIRPNGDYQSCLLDGIWNTPTLSHPRFLGLVNRCNRFYTNSSCMYYEIPFLAPGPKKVVPVGVRNRCRQSRYSDMTIGDATEKVITLLKALK